jgi:hypothetical protein
MMIMNDLMFTILHETAELVVQQKCQKLLEIAGRYQAKMPSLGRDIDEALLYAMEYFFASPDSRHSPLSVFKISLRREQAKRLRICNHQE